MSMTSNQALADRLWFFDTHPPPVAETSGLYITNHSETVAGKVRRTIVGMHVILAPGHANGLFDGLCVRPDTGVDPKQPTVGLHALLLVCDRLQIDGELWLPECDVTIHARRVEFGPNGRIKTTPQRWTRPAGADAEHTSTDPRRGEDGAHGRKAGDITVWAGESVETGSLAQGRFEAIGGAGQDPGQGKDGVAGRSVATFTEHSVFWEADWPFGDNTWHPTFNADPASYFLVQFRRMEIHWPAMNRGIGDAQWPTHGTDACEPGQPGEPGAAGLFTANRSAFGGGATARTRSGAPGATGRAAYGGAAGGPDYCYHHVITVWIDLTGTRNGTWRRESVETNPNAPMLPGKSFAAKVASVGEVEKAPRIIDSANAWVHPLLLLRFMVYVRDAYLAGQYDQLRTRLATYAAALALPCPTDVPGAAWTAENQARWRMAQTEVAGIRQRLDNQRDYFGNPPGYMPLWSLQGALQRYQLESEAAIRTLLLTRWIRDRTAALNNVEATANATLDLLDERNRQMAGQAAATQAKVAELGREVDALASQQEAVQRQIDGLRATLLDEAKGQAESEAMITAGLKIASALCQVIPVGQPFLGAAAGLASNVVPSLAFGDASAGDVVEKAGKGWESAWKDYQKSTEEAEKAGKAAAKDAEEAAKRGKREFKQKSWTKAYRAGVAEQSSAWGKVGDGMGPALAELGEGLRALQVPDTKVQAKLSQLAGQHPKFKELTRTLAGLLERKRRFVGVLSETVRGLDELYGQMATNASNAATWQQEMSEARASLSPEVALFNDDLDQRARTTLVAALYELVKAYETTVFRPLAAIDWKLDAVLDQVQKLLALEQTPAGLLAQAKALEPVLAANIQKIKESLVADYGLGEAQSLKLEYSVSENKLTWLGDHESVVIDPARKGLIPEDCERAFLADVELNKEGVVFAGPTPKSGNAVITLRVSEDGIVRAHRRLYRVHRGAGRAWTWTYNFSSKQLNASGSNQQSLDLLRMILQDDNLRQRLAHPPAWSDLVLEVRYPHLGEQPRPTLTALTFNYKIEAHPAHPDEVVLELRCDDPDIALRCDPKDLGDQDGGTTQVYGIYSRGSIVRLTATGGWVEWSAPAGAIKRQRDRPSADWQAVDPAARVVVAQVIEVAMNTSLRVRCHRRTDASAPSDGGRAQ